MRKKITAVVVALALLFSFTGCHMVFVNEEKDNALVVAKVGDKEILKEELKQEYDAIKFIYGLSDEDEMDADNRETRIEAMQQVLKELVNNELIAQCGADIGVEPLTEEELAEVDQTFEDNVGMIELLARQNFTTDIEDKDSEEYAKALALYIEAEKEKRGVNNGIYLKRLTREKYVSKVKEHIAANYEPTDEELREFYDERLASQKDLLASNPGYLSTLEDSGLVLYYPSGYRYVKNLLVAMPEDIKNQIIDLRTAGKDDEADELREEGLASIKAQADDIYAKLEGGADFDELLKQYGSDPGMTQETTKNGYRIYEGISGYDEIFVKAGMALEKVGDYSEPTGSDNGYYIIRYQTEVKEGEVSFEEAKESVKTKQVESYASTRYSEYLAEWEAKVGVTRYENNLG